MPHDGLFNIEDYCPNWGSPANCEGDSRVADLDVNDFAQGSCMQPTTARR